MFRQLLTLLVMLASAGSLPAQDWLGALRSRVAAWDELFQAPEAPEIAQVDLFGQPFALSSLRGRVVLLSFLDRESVDEAVLWLERQTTWLLHQPRVSFVNVFHPGGISFLVPRGEVVHRIRKQVRASEAAMTADLPEADRARLAQADIRWVVDWTRKLAARYPVERGRANVFLLDEAGRIREVHRYDPEAPGDTVRRGVEALLAAHREEPPPGEDL